MKCNFMKLQNVAVFERAQVGKIYPAGTIAIQISATKGQVVYHRKSKEIESRYVAVIGNDDIDKRYLYVIIKMNITLFLNKYQNGLNVIAKDIGLMEIEMCEIEKQKAIADAYFYLEENEEIIKREIENLESIKRNLLEKMFI